MTNRARSRLAAHVLGLGVLAGLAQATSATSDTTGGNGVSRGKNAAPVMLELFTSEGCSSCPPADRQLMRLAHDGQLGGVPVIALEWHVDYWNYIGWTDPFSSARYSTRQQFYARAFHTDRVYTPQIVVDGHSETQGASEGSLRELALRAAQKSKVRIALDRRDNNLAVVIDGQLPVADNSVELWLALTERELKTAVKRGENAGETLAHGPVVRSLSKLSKVERLPFSTIAELVIDRAWKRENLYAVAFVQRAGNGSILGAAELALGR